MPRTRTVLPVRKLPLYHHVRDIRHIQIYRMLRYNLLLGSYLRNKTLFRQETECHCGRYRPSSLDTTISLSCRTAPDDEQSRYAVRRHDPSFLNALRPFTARPQQKPLRETLFCLTFSMRSHLCDKRCEITCGQDTYLPFHAPDDVG